MTFLAVDPGRDTGWAAWDARGVLVACGLTTTGQIPTGAKHALIECPQVYRAGMSKGDPNDLITLAVRVGEYKERLTVAGACVTLVLPRAWKGTIDPDVFSNRTVRDMTPAESAVAATCLRKTAAGKIHNVIDAVGLGKWAFRTRVWRT